jgi:hypothetical protein
MARMYWLFPLLIAAAAVAAETFKHDPVPLSEMDLGHYRQRADRFAASSGLALLTDESPNEVRIWHSVSAIVPGIRLETWSYVIAPEYALGCRITYSQGGGTASHDRCQTIARASELRELAPIVDALLPYADSRMDCGIADGDHYTLDIVRDGKRFLIASTSPTVCRDQGSAAVAALIAAMQRLQNSIPPSR